MGGFGIDWYIKGNVTSELLAIVIVVVYSQELKYKNVVTTESKVTKQKSVGVND